jgi:PilZ domain
MASSTPRRVDFPGGIPVGVRSFVLNGKGKLLNLSATGAYISTPIYLLPQARVRLQIVLRDEKRWVETDAVVVWENRGTVGRRDGLPPGYGLRFVDVPPDARNVIEQLLTGEPAAAGAAGVASVAPPAPVASPPRMAAPATEEFKASSSTGPPPPPIPDPMRDEEPEGPPFRLRRSVVERQAPADCPGVYVLSYDRTQEARVGRTDRDLRTALASFEGEYAYFYFEAIEADDERYFRECELFHRLGGDRGQLDDTIHPVPPEGLEAECPVCIVAKSKSS